MTINQHDLSLRRARINTSMKRIYARMNDLEKRGMGDSREYLDAIAIWRVIDSEEQLLLARLPDDHANDATSSKPNRGSRFDGPVTSP